MKSDNLMRVRKRKDATFITCDVAGDVILDLVIQETLTMKPWLYQHGNEIEEYEERRERILAARYERRNKKRQVEVKSVCSVPGCRSRKQRAYLTCYRHRSTADPSHDSVNNL